MLSEPGTEGTEIESLAGKKPEVQLEERERKAVCGVLTSSAQEPAWAPGEPLVSSHVTQSCFTCDTS